MAKDRKNNKGGKPERRPKRDPHRPARPARSAGKPLRITKGRQPQEEPEAEEGMRLNKYVAHCGISSRRQAADYVKEGLVSVNGEVMINPAYQVQAGDEIRFRGKVIRPEERKVYILMNKPRDYITTVSDEHGRRTVLDLLRGKIEERIFPVGRLDRQTTGLLLLTNDGDLAKKLTHPSHKVKKVYQVTLDKAMKREDLEKMRAGIELEEGLAVVDGVDYIEGGKPNEVGIELHVGWNRIVRRLFEKLGYEVQRLDRVYLAGLTKKDLPRGFWRHLNEQEVIMLKHFT